METVHTPHSALPAGLVSLRLGVWRVILRRRNLQLQPSSIRSTLKDWTATVSEANVIHLFRDVYILGPFNFFVAVLSTCLSGIESTIVVWSSNKLLHLIEDGYRNETQDAYEIFKALLLRIFLMTIISTFRWMAARTNGVLSTRVKMHFEEQILRAHLNMDLVTSKKNSGVINVSPTSAWDAFQAFLGTLRKNSYMPLLLCVVWPILAAISEQQTLWNQGFIAYAASEPYRRLKAMYNLAMYKTEVIGGGLPRYIMAEYRKAQKLLGDTSSQYPWELYSLSVTPFLDIGTRLFDDFPLIYYAAECIRCNSPLSIASLATLQQLCGILESTMRNIIRERDNVIRNLRNLKELYHDYGSTQDMSPDLIPYSPSPDVGMGIELRDVTFQYPTGELALRHISFSVLPSSLVVIVGANGSGKSSLVNLLSGLYSPTSGDVLIDGRAAQSYYKSDLQAAVALLAQNHSIFNLSLAETIGIGDPDAAGDMKRIEQAARLGGAYDFIAKFSAGFDEVIQPVTTTFSSDYPIDDKQLREILDNVEKQKDISGGERQRLAAARTFMRLMSGKVKFVVVDEPTSAMDPLGEYELFEKLRSARAGKTMVFVTHRFGHLTKHADLILCMKNGELVETGTHQELMESGGEYHRLYDIQASAFSN